MPGDPPPWWPGHWQMGQFPTACCAPQPTYGQAFVTTLATPIRPTLSDADIDRIARRVVDLMREDRDRFERDVDSALSDNHAVRSEALPPDVRISALQDTVHVDAGPSRPAKSFKKEI